MLNHLVKNIVLEKVLFFLYNNLEIYGCVFMIKVKSVIALFTLLNDELKLLPIVELDCRDTIDNENNKYLSDNNLNVSLEQCYTFSKVDEISVLHVGFIDYKDYGTINIDLKNEYINKALEFVKDRITRLSVIKDIYKEFTLPNLQRLYENIFNVKLDRRNFRKHLIKLDVIEPINKIIKVGKGRPATVYKFKDNKKDLIIW